MHCDNNRPYQKLTDKVVCEFDVEVDIDITSLWLSPSNLRPG